jgi:competence protein ComEA
MSRDWANVATTGAAKWAAVIVLGGASVAGIVWSVRSQPGPAAVHRGASETRSAIVAGGSSRPEPAKLAPPAASREPVAETSESQAAAVEPATPKAAEKKASTVDTPSADQPPAIATKINVNTASASELELLPGIGPALAARIIEHRTQHGPFRSVADLDKVKGIGPAKLRKLREHAAVE